MIAAFISGESLFDVLNVFSPLWRSLQFAGTVTALTVFELLSPLLDLLAIVLQFVADILAILLGRVSEGVRILSQTVLQSPEIPTPESTVEAITTPSGAPKIIAAVLMLVLIGLIAWGLTRLYQQATFAARDSRRSDPLDGSGTEAPGLMDRLLERLGIFQQWRAAASIRRIYENMCRAAAAAGYPRLEAETPYEYLEALARTWPANTADSRLITEAFIRVRYGEFPETQAELDAIRAAWRQLESAEPNRIGEQNAGAPTLEKRL